mgnify:CR=1 FL=1
MNSINLNLKDMKKLSKIKLNQFSKDELDQRKLNALKGGCVCRPCTCSTQGGLYLSYSPHSAGSGGFYY